MLGPSVELDQGMAGATCCGFALLLQSWVSALPGDHQLVVGPVGVMWVGRFVLES